jgi:hypothetical protein
MSIEEIFSLTYQQTMAQRIILVLKDHPQSNAIQVVQHIWGSDKRSNCPGVLYLMDALHGLGAVTCEVIKRDPRYRSRFYNDYFTLTDKAEAVLSQLRAKHEASPYKPLAENASRFTVFRCGNCKRVTGTQNNGNAPQKSAVCTYCNHKNLLESVEVLLRTNNAAEMQSALQNAHEQRI